MSVRNLTQLQSGEKVRLTGYDHPDVANLLTSMGLLPGDEVELERFAPFGDPMAIRSGQLLICLRKNEAQHVLVDTL